MAINTTSLLGALRRFLPAFMERQGVAGMGAGRMGKFYSRFAVPLRPKASRRILSFVGMWPLGASWRRVFRGLLAKASAVESMGGGFENVRDGSLLFFRAR